MKALIYSNSEGTRLRPITSSMPECMLPVMGRPAIEHTVRHLHRHSITDVSVSCTYLADKVKKYFSLNPVSNVSLDFSATRNINDFVREDDTLILSADIITDIDFSKLIEIYRKISPDALIVTKHSLPPYEHGAVQINKDGYVTSYNKCPEPTAGRGISFAGIALLKKGTPLPDCDSIHAMIKKLADGDFSIYSYSPESYIKSISTFDNYHKCRRDFMDNKIALAVECEQKAPGVWIDKNATVFQGSIISPPVYISRGCTINKGARIDAYTELGEDVTVDCYANIKRSVVMNNTTVSEGASVCGSIVGNSCTIGSDSAVYEGTVIGFGTKIGKRTTVRNGAHIWPEKQIEDDCCISENVIWADNVHRSAFHNGSVQGVTNREITPEFAVSLGRAIATMFGGSIAVSADGNSASSMIKNALISGLQSGGCSTFDMGEQPLPITRSAVRFYSLSGGISLSSFEKDSNIYSSIDILNSSGANIENDVATKLEILMNSDSVHTSSASLIKETEYIFEYKLYYLKNLVNSTTKKKLGAKLLINCPSLWAQELLKSAAKDLDCTFDFTDSSDSDAFCREVIDGDYDLGAICDYKCESLTLVTKSGYILSEFDYCALTALIIMKGFPNALICVSASAPDSIELLSKKYGASLRRTKVSPPYLMNELSKNNSSLFLHQFIYHFDAVGAIIILLDYLYTNNTTIEELMTEIPPSGTVSTNINCSKEEQAEALQRIYLRYHISPDLDSDSVKINFENGWVIVVPQNDHNSIRIISHGYNTEYAQELADICTDDILRR